MLVRVEQKLSDTLRGLLVIAMMLGIRGQTVRAQGAPAASSADAAVTTTFSQTIRAHATASAASPDPAPASAPATSGSDRTGFYVGVRAGVSSNSSAWSATQPGGAPGLSGSFNFFHPYAVFDGSGSQFGGLAAGYNYKLRSRIVIGIEADVSFAAEPVVGAATYQDTTELFGTARGRVGYAAHHWLYYPTGGLAWTHDQFNRTDAVAASAGKPPGGSVEAAFAGRIGWTVGAGVEAPIAPGWTAKAEYLYSRFANTGVTFPLGPRVTSDLAMQQARVGLNYMLGDGTRPESAPLGVGPLDLDSWNAHVQTTYVSQYAPPFRAPYSGANSLASNIGRETWDATLYVGRRLWKGAELWINPEIDQGYGLSDTLGIAGFPSGEAYKVGYTNPYLRVPRAFVRQTFNLGGANETVEGGINQFAGSQSANRVVITIGRFSVSDPFDTITYAHDPRSDFMNWSLIDAGTFDYAADAWGFTYGAAVEWYQGDWTERAGVFDMSVVPNSIELDHHFAQFQLVNEIERRHELMGRPGKLAVVGFLSRARMGRYDDAVALARQTGDLPDTADVRRYAGRPGVNLNAEQEVVPDVGMFGRVGWADGRVESYEFTDIDRTASAGVSLGGKRWGRPGDTFGLATVINGISSAHIAYLNAGGLGILVGDGRLPHPGPEEILETYYRLPLGKLQASVDYQLIVNPAYNRDRGPVSVISARLRTQF